MSKDHAPVAGSAAAQPGVARVGRYLMLDVLGEGAFGKVRLAVDESTGNEYAMKIMAKSHIKANELTLQVRREIAVMKAMRHPNIVNLHEVLTSSKNLYMVMDLVTGGELFDAVAEHGRLSEARTRLYFQQLVDGVHYCHTRRVYHRDLKPENLLLSGDKQILKITDFGLSSIKAQNASSELLHTIMGSPHYIAPEIITSASEGYEGSKVDVWAAGVILFGMLAGFLPFDEPSTKALYKAIVHSPVQYPPHFSYDVIKLLRAMLQKDPNRRPSMEQIKGFAWFKVDYEPAVIPELKESPSSEERAKKLRSKSKKNNERGAKQRRRESVDRDSRRSVDKGSRKSVDKSTNNKQTENSSPDGKQGSKHGSELLGTSSRNNSASSEQFSEKGSVAASDDLSCNQESVDPLQIHEGQVPRKKQESETGSEKSATTQVGDIGLKSASKASVSIAGPADASDSSSEQDRIHQKEERDNVALETLQSNQNVPEGAPCSWASAVAGTDAPETETMEKDLSTRGESEVKLGPDERTDLKNDRRKEEDTNPALCSPLSPGESRFSPLNSGSLSSAPEERRQESLRFSGKVFGVTKSGLSDFISPISLQSQSSFSSPHPEGKSTSLLSPEYRSLVPRLFQSSRFFKATDARSEEKKDESVVPSEFDTELGPTGDTSPERTADSDSADISPQMRTEFDSGHPKTEVEAHAKTPEQISDDKEGIFRPMQSVFAPLAEKASEEKKVSMAPSVFCPEVDNDPESGPQWCLDSMEVFADIEGDDYGIPKTGRTTPSRKLLEILRQRQVLVEEAPVPGSIDSLTGMQTSIFAPLDDKLAFKLSPSAEAEETALKAVRKLPKLKPAV